MQITRPVVPPPQRPIRFASQPPVHHGQMRKHIADTLASHVDMALGQLTKPIDYSDGMTNRKVQAKALLNTYLMVTSNAPNPFSTLR